jgi:hypothetical protein
MFLFRFDDFDVRIWLANAFALFTLPVPVREKRLAAPRCVLIFGMFDLLLGSYKFIFSVR